MRPIIIDKYKSPNFNERISSIVLHHTVTSTLQEALNIFLNDKSSVSTHYLIDTNGDIYQLVADDKRAWHAGVSAWSSKIGLNDTSIGIEIVNRGDKPFAEQQMNAIIKLVDYLRKLYDITPFNIIAHADIGLGRKYDPNGYFEWSKLYKGLDIFRGLFDNKDVDKQILIDDTTKKIDIKTVQGKLKQVGYSINITGIYDTPTANLFHAFNQHFVPEIFVIETINDKQQMIINRNNNRWYGISEHRLNKLLTFK